MSTLSTASAPASVIPARRSGPVAILWQRFGPYHLARLRGAARVLAGDGYEVVGIEVAGADHYDWRHVDDDAVARWTLFPRRGYEGLGAGDVRRAVTSVLDRLRASAVCINGWSAAEAVAALRWCGVNGSRAILMSETFESRFNPVKRTVRQWRVARCDAAVVGGRVHAQYLRDLGFRGRALELGYDVVDNAHFAAPARTAPSWVPGISRQQYFFANTRFLERKGIDALLRAYATYLHCIPAGASSPPWHLVVSGSGTMERPWKHLAASLGVADRVHWPGFLQYDELPAAYQHAGAFVHPARREPWGLVVNEAAAAGLPLLVGRRVGAACELVRDGENGFLVDPDDTGAFAALLLKVWSLPVDERQAMGERSRQIISVFGPERFGQALRRCLARIH